MQISDHYLGYPHETIIVVTNNQQAKLLQADGREIEEIAVIKIKQPKDEQEDMGATPEKDEQRLTDRSNLYVKLSKKLRSYVKKGSEHIILCAPEALRSEITEAMHEDVMNRVDEVVPKNLASLELEQIVRILQEKRPV